MSQASVIVVGPSRNDFQAAFDAGAPPLPGFEKAASFVF